MRIFFKYFFFSIIIFLMIVYAIVRSEAAPIKNQNVMAVWVSGPYGLTNTRANTALKLVSKYYQKQLGVRIRVVKWVRMKELPGKIDLKNYIKRFERYKGYAGWRFNKYKMPKIFVIPPYMEGTERYMGGVASAVCDKFSGVAVGVGEESNDLGEYRFVHSQLSIAHELGHVLGANHVESYPATLMHPNALPYVENSILPMHVKTRKEIRKCLKMK